MSGSGKNGCGFFFVLLLLLISVGMNFFLLGCRQPSPSPKPDPIRNPSADVLSDLQELARSCGVKNVETMTAYGLIAETRMQLRDKKYYGLKLSPADKKELEDFLADAPQLLKTILSYDQYIQKQAQ